MAGLPTVILVMRHAEKPVNLSEEGLSDAGTAHAESW